MVNVLGINTHGGVKETRLGRGMQSESRPQQTDFPTSSDARMSIENYPNLLQRRKTLIPPLQSSIDEQWGYNCGYINSLWLREGKSQRKVLAKSYQPKLLPEPQSCHEK